MTFHFSKDEVGFIEGALRLMNLATDVEAAIAEITREAQRYHNFDAWRDRRVSPAQSSDRACTIIIGLHQAAKAYMQSDLDTALLACRKYCALSETTETVSEAFERLHEFFREFYAVAQAYEHVIHIADKRTKRGPAINRDLRRLFKRIAVTLKKYTGKDIQVTRNVPEKPKSVSSGAWAEASAPANIYRVVLEALEIKSTGNSIAYYMKLAQKHVKKKFGANDNGSGIVEGSAA